jgi:hypothetical protein
MPMPRLPLLVAALRAWEKEKGGGVTRPMTRERPENTANDKNDMDDKRIVILSSFFFFLEKK